MNTPLDISRAGPITRVTLCRPEVHNAFDAGLIAELTKAFKAIGKDPATRVVVLAGEGKNFCAGADLNWMKSTAAYKMPQNQKDALKMHQMLEMIYHCPKPTVARVQGIAFGGGVGLISVADISVCSQDAQLCLSEVKLGILPAVIGPFVIRKIGVSYYRAYGLSAKKLSADESLRVGFVQEVVPFEQLDLAVDRWVDTVLQNGPEAMAHVKLISEKVRTISLAQASGITTKTIAKARAGSEGQEGMKAFFEKRSPFWRATR